MTRRMRQKTDVSGKANDTRQRIVEAILALVARDGVNNITLMSICDEARITHGGFYFHFKNKDEALTIICRDWLAQFKQSVLDVEFHDDFHEEAYQIILTYLKGYSRDIELTKLVYSMDALQPEVRAVFGSYQQRWWARLENRFREERRKLGLSTGLELILAHAMTAALEGLAVDTYLVGMPELRPAAPSPDVLARHVALIWYRTVLGRDPSRLE